MDRGHATGRHVRGVLRFPLGGSYACVRVSLRRVDVLDGPAETVATRELRQVIVPAGGGDVPFDLDLPDLAAHRPADLAWRAHADRGCTGAVDVGDLVTTSTEPLDVEAQSVILTLTPV